MISLYKKSQAMTSFGPNHLFLPSCVADKFFVEWYKVYTCCSSCLSLLACFQVSIAPVISSSDISQNPPSRRTVHAGRSNSACSSDRRGTKLAASILERHNKIATIKGCTSREEPACWDREAVGYYDRPSTAESGPLTQAVDHATWSIFFFRLLGFVTAALSDLFFIFYFFYSC